MTFSRCLARLCPRGQTGKVGQRGQRRRTVRATSPAPGNAPLPTLRALHVRSVQLPELLLLRPIRVEILRRQPPFERGLPGRPLGFQHREPGGIAAAALDDHVVAENALERKTETERGAARRGIEGIAFPLVAAKPKRLENIARQEILRLRGERCALERRTEQDVADLDDPHVGLDPQERRKPERASGRVHDGIIKRIACLLARYQPIGEYGPVSKWAVTHISPEMAVARHGVPQVRVMTRRIEALDAAMAAA